MNKLIWITGAHGFIGRHLAKWLSSQGYTIIGLGHGPWPHSEAMQWGVHRWLNGGIHSGNLQQLLRDDGAPDCIFHLAGGSSVGAAIASPHEDFARTVVTTAELLDWIRREAPNSRLVAVSSAAVYGAGHSEPLREDGAYLPFSPYGHHKLMMEQLCRSYMATYNLPVAVVRLFSVYGSWLKKQLLWDMCSSLASGIRDLQLGGTGDELRDWTDIRDVVRVLELAMKLPIDPGCMPVINGGSGQGTSVAQIATMVLESWPNPSTVTFSGKSRPGDPFALVADGSRLQTAGFEWRISALQGIREYVQWYLRHSKGEL